MLVPLYRTWTLLSSIQAQVLGSNYFACAPSLSHDLFVCLCLQSYNTKIQDGGALWLQSALMLGRAVRFQSNDASRDGRAIYLEKSTVAEVRSRMFAANQIIYGATDTAHNAVVLNDCGPVSADEAGFVLAARGTNSFLVYDRRTAAALQLSSALATTPTRPARSSGATDDILCSHRRRKLALQVQSRSLSV
jgi:hypothetical protein